MFCNKCGADFQGQAYCPRCGAPASASAPNMAAQPGTVNNPACKQVLIYGILGLALGCATGIVGLIFSILGLKKANSFINTYGDISNQVRIGRRLSIAGLIVSIAMIVLVVTIVTVVIVVAINDPEALKSAVSSADGKYEINFKI